MAERQEEASADAMLTRIGQAVMLHRGGDREEARNRLGELWLELGADGDTFHRCTLAHYLADTQDDPTDELAWDLRALAAADRLLHGQSPECGWETPARWSVSATSDGATDPEVTADRDEVAGRGAGAPGDRGRASEATGPGRVPEDEPWGAIAGDRDPGAAECDGGIEARRRAAVAAVRGLYPSLHLNLAADYAKLGRPDAARAQLDLARGASGALGDDPYGHGVRAAIGLLARRLSDAPGEHAPPPGHRPWS
ncbi:hypothetical protein [Streptomyces sp. NPDC057702]|uniref:hypothetical protein n=1 Tax=unclassified Streptomyces TaxID=2593676 RepID=UPI00369B105A